MKKSLIAVAVLGAFAGAAHAEDQKNPSVTVYGVIDAAIRYNTNATYTPATNTPGSYIGFSQGLFNGSRFGVKGTEDLGNGTKAIYDLEAGLVLGTGASDQQGQLFGRQAWVGLSDETWGSLTAGRQYGNFSGAIGTGDVFGELHGNEVYGGGAGLVNGTASPNQGDTASENGFMYQEMGYRWDNSLLYANKLGPVNFSLMHSFQGQTNSATNATSGQTETMNAVAIGYTSNDFNITAGYQKETNAAPTASSAGATPTHTGLGVGANYQYGDKAEFGGRNGVYAYYLSSKFDAGFTRIGLGTNSEFSGMQLTAREDKIMSISTNYYVTGRTNLIAGYYHDSASNVLDPATQATYIANVGGTSGSRNGLLLVADYYFSKNTDTYAMVAHTAFKGALIGNANGGNATTGEVNGVGPASVNTAMVGMRHRF